MHPLPSLFQLLVKGYNDKLHVLLEKIMERMTSFQVDPKRFEILKDAVSSPNEYSFQFSCTRSSS